MQVDQKHEWVSFSLADGREGSGADLVEGRGKTLDEALETALGRMSRLGEDEERFGPLDAHIIWRNGDLAAVIRPPLHHGGPLFIVRFDYDLDEEQPEALDAACADYLAAREALAAAADARELYRLGLEGETVSEAERATLAMHDTILAEKRAAMNGFRRVVTRLAFEALGLTDPSPLHQDCVGAWHPFGIETDRHTVYLEPYRDANGGDLDYSDPVLSVIPRATIVRLHRPATLEA